MTEGFEARITWPSAISNSDGSVINVTDRILQYKRASDSRTITIRLIKNGLKLAPLVSQNDSIREGQIIASVVPIITNFKCENSVSEEHYLKLLDSSSITERYAAAKALAYFKSNKSEKELIKNMNDSKDHIYIRLECASSLLKRGNNSPLKFFEKILGDEYLENRLECIIILGEIKQKDSRTLLIKALLDKAQHPEIRAGAAWSLGELRDKESLEALINVFSEMDLNIRAEAARALVKINKKFVKNTIEFFSKSGEDARAGIAWSLSKSGNFVITDLQKVIVDDEARKWAAWIIGTQKEEQYINQLEELKNKDKEVYFAATVLWKVLSSWIDGLDIY